MHPCVWSEAVLLAACREESSRGSRPGGQHANVSASGVRLVYLADPAIRAKADEERDRRVNRRRALRRMRMRLALAIRGGSDPAVLDAHRARSGFRISVKSDDFPAVICVLLDALEEAEGELVSAARACKLGTSPYVRTLALDKQAWQAAQVIRRRHGHAALRHS